MSNEKVPRGNLYCSMSAKHLFRTIDNPAEDEETETETEPEIRLEIPTFVCNDGNRTEDIAEVHPLGFIIDNNNEPAPENIPASLDNNNIAATDGLEWGWAGIDHRKWANGQAMKARINCLSGIALQGATLLTMLLLFLPWKFIEDVILVQTNNKILGSTVTFEEFLRFLGLWLYMSTLSGFWWLFNDFMTFKRCEAILLALSYTDKTPPAYKDKSCEVRQIITTQNKNMTKIFTSSWVSCLY
jgi:hypothetical protein